MLRDDWRKADRRAYLHTQNNAAADGLYRRLQEGANHPIKVHFSKGLSAVSINEEGQVIFAFDANRDGAEAIQYITGQLMEMGVPYKLETVHARVPWGKHGKRAIHARAFLIDVQDMLNMFVQIGVTKDAPKQKWVERVQAQCEKYLADKEHQPPAPIRKKGRSR